MTLSFADRVQGAAAGLAIGDALTWSTARLAPDVASAQMTTTPMPHGATTTWAMLIANALVVRTPHETLTDALTTRLIAWTAPMRGSAVRSAPGGFGVGLRQLGRALERGDDGRIAALDEVVADPIAACVPLAFTLTDADDDVIRALVDVVSLTHRALRVTTSTALFIGGFRAHLRALHRGQPADADVVFDAATAFAAAAQDVYLERRHGIVVGNPLEAEGARAMAIAAARHAARPPEIWAPAGLDGRDTPERCAAGALVGLDSAPKDVLAIGLERAQEGGDGDVTLPLWLSILGASVGADKIPLGLASRAASVAAVGARFAVLTEKSVAPREDLVVEELRMSAQLLRAEPSDQTRDDGLRIQAELTFDG